MLEVSHNHWLIGASLAVAMMSGFTGLSLLKGASQATVERRKRHVALAAIAMGGGIWSMHFVAMLGLQLPIPFFYDILATLASALIAILVVGMAFLILHFVKRDRNIMISAGVLVGLGIIIMHYLGMSGMRGALPQYSGRSVGSAILLSASLGIITFLVAYSDRKSINILLGTIFFGVAVFSVHFVAMYGTSFHAVSDDLASTILISNESLAIGVAVAAFVICGAFLLTGITFITPSGLQQPSGAAGSAQNGLRKQNVGMAEDPLEMASANAAKEADGRPAAIRIPYEREGRAHFIPADTIAIIRAEGHYSYLYANNEKLFCPWSISQIASRLKNSQFIRCHRSYLINPEHVIEFERKKDNGICYFSNSVSLEKVPVSRSQLKTVREALGLM